MVTDLGESRMRREKKRTTFSPWFLVVKRNGTLASLTRDDALSVLSLWAVQRVEEVRQAADGDGTEAGIEVCFACEPDRSDCCRRENPLHALLSLHSLAATKSRAIRIASESVACLLTPTKRTRSIPGRLSRSLPETRVTRNEEKRDVF